jgi:voltage-gated sodium channel
MKNFLLKDRNIIFLIIINSLIIFFSGFEYSSNANLTLLFFDNFISSIFIVEIIVKIRHYKSKVFFSDGWNLFDFFLVVLSIPSLLIFVFDLEIKDVSFILVFRTFRIIKVFRFFKFIPNIEKLLSGIKSALKASVLVLVSFVIYIFIISMLSHSMFSYSELFSDPGTSVYSVLKIFTLEGWYEFPDQLTEETGVVKTFFIRLYFILILLSGGIFGLSLVNSIFVDAMVSDNNDELEAKVDELKQMVQKLIDNKNNLL